MVTALVELVPGAALVFARALALAAAAPVVGGRHLTQPWRLALAGVLALALAPLRAEQAPPVTDLLAFVPALLLEATVGLVIGLLARFALIAAEVCGQLVGISLGLGFAEQYDPRHGEAAGILPALTRAAASLAFVTAGGLAALARALAAPLPSAAGLEASAAAALDVAAAAATWGLSLAAPVVLAALVANLAVALAHRASPAVNLFAVGLSTSLLIAGAALLAGSPQLVDGLERLAARAISMLASGGAS